MHINLAEFLFELRSELNQAVKMAEQEDIKFKLKDIELEFEVVATQSEQEKRKGGIAFKVLSGGMEKNDAMGTTKTQKLKMTLSPVGADGSPTLVNQIDSEKPPA